MAFRSVTLMAVALALFAVAFAHFEKNGSVPLEGSTTAEGDPTANIGEEGPKPGSPAAAAAARENSAGSGTGPAAGGDSGSGGDSAGSGDSEGSDGSDSAVAAGVAGGLGAGAAGVAASGRGDGVSVSTPEPNTADPATPADDADDSTPAASGAEADDGASPTPEESDEPDESEEASDEDDDDGSVCFPSDATVELKDGSVVPMSRLSIGDMVKVSATEYSKVFMFTHKMADVAHKFVTLTTASGASLSLTKGHYIHADGSLVAASNVKVGSVVNLGNGAFDTVASVSSSRGTGLYNPQTVHGDIVVNGVVASTYTTSVEPSFAHAILAPFRFLNVLGLQTTALESGSQRLADVAPTGTAVVF